MKRKTIPYGRQHITQDDIDAVVATLKSDFLTQGPKVEEFELRFSEYVDAKYAVAVSNGTAALHLGVQALGIKPGQKVLVPTITFVASANAVRYCGGEVVFCDIDPKTYVIDLNDVEAKLANAQPGEFAGIIPVDFAGHPVDVIALRKIADKYGLWILEDACHAPGAYFVDEEGNAQRCGNAKYSDICVFSFHPVKHLTTGEGGMLTTRNEQLYERLLRLRSHGITKDKSLLTKPSEGGWYYEQQELGYNYRMSDIQAALGLSQLRRADKMLQNRRNIAEIYNRSFNRNNKEIVTPFRDKGIAHAYHLYVIQVPNRRQVYSYLHGQGVLAQIHYIPVHLQPYYRALGNAPGQLPVAEAYYSRCLSLPMFPTMKEEDYSSIVRIMNEALLMASSKQSRNSKLSNSSF